MLFLFSNSFFAQDNTQNWVKQIAYKAQTATPIATPTAAQAQVSVTYLDGLGRTVQQVANKMANNGNDIVSYIEYDSSGRQSKQYLPYVATTSTMAYDASLFGTTSSITGYLNTTYPSFSGQNLYSETQFENSPLNRVMKQAAPGTDWKMDSGKEVKYDYQANTKLGDKVRQFSVYGMTGTLTETTNYEDNTLYKTIVYDENTTPLTPKAGIEEFKNLKGQVVLKRTYASDNGNTTPTAHDTYNVYDELDNLRYVISPKAVDAATLTPQIVLDLCYTYKYDYRNRLIEKKEPGKQWQFIVYDELNRIVATGPAINPFGGLDTDTGWLRTYYDNLNRVCYSGWLSQTSITNITRATLQASFTGVAVNNVSKTTSGTIDGKTVFYSYTAIEGLKLLTVNYYDNYNFPDAPTVFSTTIANQTIHYNNSTQLPRGLPTGTWTRALTTASLAGETAYILYDYRARPIETKNTNYLGGFTRTQTKLDFVGKIEYNLTSHSLNNQTATVVTKDVFTYSDQDRMLVHTNQVNPNDPVVANRGGIEVLTNNNYSNIGQLLNKKVGDIDPTGTNYLQKVDYTYNVRGWLKGINNVGNLTQGTDKKDVFAYQLNYNDSTTGKLYNGNISETLWRTNNDNILRKYSYQYDEMNRLLNAVYIKPEASVANSNNYGETISYDQNSNITHINRSGNYDVNGFALQIDNLTYKYADNSNQLMMVYDSTNSTQGFKDNTRTAGLLPQNDPDDYAYDLNGNQTRDNNKTITSIKYNHLNLPTEIIFANTNTKITYLYNAAGVKLQKLVQTTATAKKQIDYLGGFQYLKSTITATARLQFFPTSEGYISVTYDSATVNKYNYVYNYLDQLGNVRLSYGKDPITKVLTILEENNYYPYGLKHSNYNNNVNAYYLPPTGTTVTVKPVTGTVLTDITVNAYKYNGKEYQDELALNLYDMDMRDYDPATARWTGIDPVTHHSQSPYNAFDSNPVSIADPNGADGTRGDGNGGTIYTNAYGTSSSPGYNGYSSMGSGWHVGSQLIGGPIDGSSGGLFGDFYNINANNPGLSVWGKTWVTHTTWNPIGITGRASGSVGSIVIGAEMNFETITTGRFIENSPDADGYLTQAEADNWFKIGRGMPLFVDINKIDLSGIRTNDFRNGVGTKEYFNLLVYSGTMNDGIVYGNIGLRLYPNNQVQAFQDTYDFEQKSWVNPLNWGRNIETYGAAAMLGPGVPFKINIVGSKPISSRIFFK